MNALIFLIDTFARLWLLAFLLRLLLQLARADFYNPISQFVVQVTNPLVVPARRIIPSARNFDLPTFVVLFLLQFIVTIVLLALRGVSPSFFPLLWIVVFQLASLVIGTYIFCILAYVLLSWFGQMTYNPVATFLGQLVSPVLRPARRVLPPVGGLDLSPMIVMILLMAALIALGDLRTLLL